MLLVARSADPADLPTLLRLSYPAHEGHDEAAVTSEWRTLWSRGAMFGVAADDMSAGAPVTRALMLGVYVTQGFYELAGKAPEPNVIGRLAQALQRNEPVIVPEAKYGALNSGEGMCLLVTYVGWEGADYFGETSSILRSFITNAFVDRHGGQNLAAAFGEVGGAHLLEICRRIGLQVLNDYAGWAEESGQQEAPKRPYLVGTTRGAALTSENHWLTSMFRYLPPRFYFTDYQREILLLARDGVTDAEIADRLGISAEAVKKRWAAIYERVMEQLPGLLPENSGGSRGTEKRRALLNHLRDRREELRPYDRR